MERKKQRKLLATLAPGMPPKYVERALNQVSNDRTRSKLRARYLREKGGR